MYELFCASCEKEVETEIKITNSDKYWWNKYTFYKEYERNVCVICHTELLIKEGLYVNSKCERSGT